MNKPYAKTLVLITVIIMDLLTGMEFDLFVPSFPQLQTDFNLTPFWVEALLSSNYLGYCLSLFYVGKLADQFGRKPVILLGLLIFIVGSVCCLYAQTYPLLILGRFLQGVGVAAPAVLSFLIIADSYALQDQQFIIAMLNGVMNIAVAISPVIGSYLTLYYHWQGNFVALLYLCMAALTMTLFFIPMRKIPNSGALPSENIAKSNGYGVILISKPLMLLIICMLCLFVPYWIFAGMSSLLYIEDLHVSLAQFGYYQGALAFVFAVGCVMFGLSIRKKGYDTVKMLTLSYLILIVSFIIFVLMMFFFSNNPLVITLSLLPFIVSQIIPSVILYPLSLNFLPTAKARVSAFIQGTRLILTAIALQITGYFYQHTFTSIGIAMSCFIIGAIATMYYVIRNKELMSVRES